jgi:hypothetical protein
LFSLTFLPFPANARRSQNQLDSVLHEVALGQLSTRRDRLRSEGVLEELPSPPPMQLHQRGHAPTGLQQQAGSLLGHFPVSKLQHMGA